MSGSYPNPNKQRQLCHSHNLLTQATLRRHPECLLLRGFLFVNPARNLNRTSADITTMADVGFVSHAAIEDWIIAGVSALATRLLTAITQLELCAYSADLSVQYRVIRSDLNMQRPTAAGMKTQLKDILVVPTCQPGALWMGRSREGEGRRGI
ncbi:hypothetical protein BU26DRAFT_119183 [Trematosphaeria pertusa]|uniref:Uncharacterized protein n=1 Tax=Trematosphaeria pertusa TaxID=390896 RepID=A0A6A6HZ81_9PLEO|nr:uncharacterized protein BU26DRAFT_119183 [Trematosphaeria pertusa]KAF2243544.1 hypothetical protein BU26DRAFT_119183 [Trematosphaeria pertusa]